MTKREILFMIEAWVVYIVVEFVTKNSDIAMFASIITGMTLIYSKLQNEGK